MKNTSLYLLDLTTSFPQMTDANLIYPEFETYYQSIIHKLTNLPETDISHLKAKLRSACEKYNTIKIPYKEKEVINKLSKNPPNNNTTSRQRQRNSYHGQREIHRKIYENTQYQTISQVKKRSYKKCRNEDTKST